MDKKYSELYDRLYSAYSEIDDIADSTKNLIEEVDVSEYNSDTIEERLAVISIEEKIWEFI